MSVYPSVCGGYGVPGPPGPPGPPGSLINAFRGMWMPNTAYQVGDLVYHDETGSTYILMDDLSVPTQSFFSSNVAPIVDVPAPPAWPWHLFARGTSGCGC